MPRFYFHLRDGRSLFRDWEGRELNDEAEARRYATTSARALVATRRNWGIRQGLDCSLEVTDAAGRKLTVVPFVEALGGGDGPDRRSARAPDRPTSRRAS
jgi:hypothetical protein